MVMIKRPAIILSLFCLCVCLTFSQVFVSKVSAVSPLTSPVTAFLNTISGKITIKHIGWWHHASLPVMPFNNVVVKLWNFSTHEVTQTNTDVDGNYMFSVDKGMYKVMPIVDEDVVDVMAPPFQVVFVNKKNRMNVNFHALDF